MIHHAYTNRPPKMTSRGPQKVEHIAMLVNGHWFERALCGAVVNSSTAGWCMTIPCSACARAAKEMK